ncbi:MAG TPA: polyprenyl diphosphate synthase [Stellaceae bacterium]|nr:polyprenyl diphosphate synthase [Stellaceae bacterium]
MTTQVHASELAAPATGAVARRAAPIERPHRGGLLRWVARPLYRLYEHRLARQVEGRDIPRHIGIILDGNRRWGARRGLSDPCAIYTLGAHKLDDVLAWCGELAVPAVTLWVFSTDNQHRPRDQVSGMLDAIEAKVRTLADHPTVHHRRVRVRAIGQLETLPPSLVEALAAAGEATANYDGMLLTIAVGYGGRDEIVDAVRALLAEQAQRGLCTEEAITEITEDGIARHLYMAGSPDPDLIIRTSGEVRLSGFLLWQSAYSEFYFCDVPWPALRKIDFLRAVRAYQQRHRRFGR